MKFKTTISHVCLIVVLLIGFSVVSYAQKTINNADKITNRSLDKKQQTVNAQVLHGVRIISVGCFAHGYTLTAINPTALNGESLNSRRFIAVWKNGNQVVGRGYKIECITDPGLYTVNLVDTQTGALFTGTIYVESPYEPQDR